MMELNIVQFINHLGSKTIIDTMTVFISQIPFLIILWLVCCIIALVLDKKQGKFVFLTVLLAIAIHFIISEGIFKHLLPAISDDFFRQRPWLVSPDVRPLGKHFTDSSFPSSHMASTLAALTALCYYYRKAIPAAIIFILMMAFARMHNGMHYPTDILTGTALGIIYSLLAITIIEKKLIKNKK